MIELRDLRKDFGAKTVINGVNLRVRPGEKLVLLGPSGCGKTTLLRMINRLLEPTSGSVWFEGTDAGKYDPVLLRRKLGYVVQDGGLLPHRTVRENIFTVPRLLGWSTQQCEDRLFVIKAILWLFDSWFEMFPHELSGGQRQRVALARALIADPAALLMDEPFSGLDPMTRQLIRREVRGLWALRDKTIIMVTHDISEAFEFGDRVALMSSGTIQQVGTPSELLFRPRNEFVQNFFNQTERIHHEWQAVRLMDLELGPAAEKSPRFDAKIDLPATATIAEALAAMGGDTKRSSALLEAFQKHKVHVRAAAPEQDPQQS